MFRHRIIDSRFFSSCFRATRPVLSFLLSSFSLRPSLILTDASAASGPGQIEAPPGFAGAPRSPYGLRPQFFDSFVHASWKKVSNFGIYYKLSLTIYIYIYELVDKKSIPSDRGGPCSSALCRLLLVMGKGVPMKILRSD